MANQDVKRDQPDDLPELTDESVANDDGPDADGEAPEERDSSATGEADQEDREEEPAIS